MIKLTRKIVTLEIFHQFSSIYYHIWSFFTIFTPWNPENISKNKWKMYFRHLLLIIRNFNIDLLAIEQSKLRLVGIRFLKGSIFRHFEPKSAILSFLGGNSLKMTFFKKNFRFLSTYMVGLQKKKQTSSSPWKKLKRFFYSPLLLTVQTISK